MRHNDRSNASSLDMRAKPADITSQREGDSVTVVVAGEMDLSTADRLDTTIRDAEKTEIGRIVVDLSSLSFIDSTALGVLLDAIKRNRRRGGNRLSFVPSKHGGVTKLLALNARRVGASVVVTERRAENPLNRVGTATCETGGGISSVHPKGRTT